MLKSEFKNTISNNQGDMALSEYRYPNTAKPGYSSAAEAQKKKTLTFFYEDDRDLS